jgi:hypothetical protein
MPFNPTPEIRRFAWRAFLVMFYVLSVWTAYKMGAGW